jgi:YVTN family beta-propeller protein
MEQLAACLRRQRHHHQPDGRRFYFTNEADHTLDIVDGSTYKVTGKVALTGRPNNLSISRDGRRLYVAIRSLPGAVGPPRSATHRGCRDRRRTALQSHRTAARVGQQQAEQPVYVYSLPDLKLLSGIYVGDHPDWLTITPDGKSVYVANAGSNSVSVLDAASRKEITRIPVGQVPKRNITAVWPLAHLSDACSADFVGRALQARLANPKGSRHGSEIRATPSQRGVATNWVYLSSSR